ncbi:TDT family transporter [Thermococcus waiotapuensis]|uniref:Tellurite-resistance/dicarboxylate transporter n=1 Tax=Thermococcus waiotapuensis TaxID=90909 RepID=A0AAE4NTD4_9EURY|nr:tellurite-resistance/dicarboxylate transporter [Thermococcus waiotapuensis]MDV3103514.1 tellurite-resistance/dicarboxylate transporter [Thermococcus waiotapuensis]
MRSDESERQGLLGDLSEALVYLNAVVFFLLLIPWLLRWVKYPEDAKNDLYHPVTSHFYGTMPIAMVIVAMNLAMAGHTGIAFPLWLIGSLLVMAFAFFIPYLFFVGEGVDIKTITPAWFIPPVGLMVLPLTATPFVPLSDQWKGAFIALNYFGFGAGFFLYLALFAIVMGRFITHELMPPMMAPSVWINLGPLGAGAVALLNLSKMLPVGIEALKVFAFFLWGFGTWWLVMAVLITLHYLRNLHLPYSLAWWAFIFPLGAYVSATHSVGIAFGIDAVDSFGFAVYWLLLALWLITGVKTLKHTLLG